MTPPFTTVMITGGSAFVDFAEVVAILVTVTDHDLGTLLFSGGGRLPTEEPRSHLETLLTLSRASRNLLP